MFPKTDFKRSDTLLLCLLCSAFVMLGWPFLSRMGIEADEALIGTGLYLHEPAVFSWHLAGHAIPLMILNYLGALKVWLYSPLLAIEGPSQITLRLPTLLLGAATVALFWLVLRDIHGRSAAWIGALLLASDTSFLLLTTIDFGPIALQLFLKILIVYLFIRWKRSGRIYFFAGAWFLVGLAFWDKALFAWIAAGMFAGAAAAFPRDLLRACRIKLAAIASLAFCLGALPLIAFNVVRPLETIRSNAKIVPEDAFAKVGALAGTVNGSLLFGFYTAADSPPKPGNVDTGIPGIVSRALQIARSPTQNWTPWAAVVSLCVLPFLWNSAARQPALFGSVSFVVGWLLMAVTAGAGGAAHHVALLWPMQFFLVAPVLAEFSGGGGGSSPSSPWSP